MCDVLAAMDDWCKSRAVAIREKAGDHVMSGRSLEAPRYRTMLGEHRAYMAMRSFIHGCRRASVDTHPKGGDSTKIEAPFMSGAVGEAETPNLSPPSGHQP